MSDKAWRSCWRSFLGPAIFWAAVMWAFPEITLRQVGIILAGAVVAFSIERVNGRDGIR